MATMLSYKDIVQEGEHIILEMQCGDVFEGDVVNVGQNLFELVNILQYNNPNKLLGVYTFYRTEIERIFKFKTEIIRSTEERIDSKLYISRINKEEFNRLNEMSRNFIYLENADSRYYKAIKDLETSETIGVVPLGMDKSMMTDVKLLGICTRQQVYLFDLIDVKNRSFYPELKQIFESKYICKVFHGGMAFIDILFKNYKVYVSNVFDTQITDLLIEKRKARCLTPTETKSLAHCIKIYIKLPPSILKIPQEITRKQWSERPLNNKYKLNASQLCTFLIKLQQMMKNVLLKGIFDTTDVVYDHVRSLSDVEFGEYVANNKVPEAINVLIPIPKKQKIRENNN